MIITEFFSPHRNTVKLSPYLTASRGTERLLKVAGSLHLVAEVIYSPLKSTGRTFFFSCHSAIVDPRAEQRKLQWRVKKSAKSLIVSLPQLYICSSRRSFFVLRFIPWNHRNENVHISVVNISRNLQKAFPLYKQGLGCWGLVPEWIT